MVVRRTPMRTMMLVTSIIFSQNTLSKCFDLKFGDSPIRICSASGIASASNANGKFIFDRKLSYFVNKAEKIYVIRDDFKIDEEGAALIYASLPSKLTRGSGYCGSGNEGYALLISENSKNLFLKDSKLIQSCLKNISLSSDQGDDPKVAIRLGKLPTIAIFDLITDRSPEVVTNKLILRRDKLILSPSD